MARIGPLSLDEPAIREAAYQPTPRRPADR
ncbi:hypothetical protein SRB17_14330 [Streptomyces sp. RB17]|nr:hypothetical protein [Streptomyces sp. RB17]